MTFEYKRGYNVALDEILALLQTIPTEDYENAEKLRKHLYNTISNMPIEPPCEINCENN